MELRDFVAQTLIQVIEGVKQAQEAAKAAGGLVSPRGVATGDKDVAYTRDGEIVQFIAFDVAVTTTEADSAKGGIGIFVGGLGVGVQGNEESRVSALNRIQFSVPVSLPRHGPGG